MSERIYWAAKPPDEIVNALRPKVEAYYEWVRSSGRLSMWARTHRQYYAGLVEGGALGSDGDVDELISVNVNDYRNLIQHVMTMVTSQRPQFEPRAVNADHRSQTQTILAQGILEYVLKQKQLEHRIKQAFVGAMLFNGSDLSLDWDATAGTPFGVNPDGQTIERSGDLEFGFYSPLDVVRDFCKTDMMDHQWHISRDWENRWDMMARYPEQADQIANMPTKVDAMKRPRFVNMFVNMNRYETEDIEVWSFYHEKSDALPEGRKTIFLLDAGDVLPLYDGPLPFDDLPLYHLTSEPMLGTSHGYSPANDLLSLQEATNALWSTLASNVAAFGVQNILTPEGSNIDVANLGGLKIIKFDSKLGPPSGLNLTQNSPDTYKLLDLLEQAMETLSGVNSVARGNPEESLKSGAALALVQSQALQFNLPTQESYTRWLEDVATGVIHVYKRFAKAPQVALIAGRGNRSYIQEFTGDDLDRIDRVAVDLGNPLSRTVAGRVQIAELLGSKGLLKTPEEYIMVLTTGRLEPVIEPDQKEMLNIRAENEALSDAGNEPMPPPVMTPMGPQQAPPPSPVQAFAYDNHPAHIREHCSIISSPEARENPMLLMVVKAHMDQHMELWMSMPPPIAMAMGIPPPPMPPPMLTQPGAPGQPSQTPPPQPGASIHTGPQHQLPPAGLPGKRPKESPGNVLAPGQAVAGLPTMPGMPKNPLTGERAPGVPPPS